MPSTLPLPPLAVALALSALPVLASAQPATEPDPARMEAAQEALFEGQGHLRARRYREGIAAYERAYEFFPDPRYLFTIASAWDRIGDACAARLAAWDRFLDACEACAERTAGDAAHAATREGCIVRYRVTTSPDGAQVEVDGGAAGRAPLQTELVAGEHTLVVSAPGHGTVRRTVRVTMDGGSDLHVTLQANVAAAPVESPLQTETSPTEGPGPWPWVAIGVGSAGAALGTVAILRMNDSIDTFDSARTRDDAVSARDEADTWALVAQAGFGVAAAGILTGIVLLARGPSYDTSALAPTVGPGGAGVAGRF
ncbi:MAG: PEGA domain-containing protein [Planctomycetota bacterium]|jgi:hypothetical protein